MSHGVLFAMRQSIKMKIWLLLASLLFLITAADAMCGNGILDLGELCDPGIHLCCAPNCLNVLLVNTVCRSASGSCDVFEVCDGFNFTCPANLFQVAGFPCRPVLLGDTCDIAEGCTGTAPQCPPDLAAPSTVRCRTKGVGTECVADAYCPGTLPSMDPNSKVCPNITYLGDAENPVVCRETPNQCDVPEFCPAPGSGMAGSLTPWACPLDINRGTLAAHPTNLFLQDVGMCDIDGLFCTKGECNAATGLCVEPASTIVNCPCSTDLNCVTNSNQATSEGNRFSYVNEGLHPASNGVLNQAYFNYYGGVFNVTANAYLKANFFMSYNRNYQKFFDGNYRDVRNDLSPGFNLDYSRNNWNWPDVPSLPSLCDGSKCVANVGPWPDDDWFNVFSFVGDGTRGHCYIDGAHWLDTVVANSMLSNAAGPGWPNGGFVSVLPGATDARVGQALLTDVAMFTTNPANPCQACTISPLGTLATTWTNLGNNQVCLLPPNLQNLPCSKNPWYGKCTAGNCLPVPLVSSVPVACIPGTGGICLGGNIQCQTGISATLGNFPLLASADGPFCKIGATVSVIKACAVSEGNCGYDSFCEVGNYNCPAPVVLPSSTICRNSQGDCDPEEKCSGSSTACPPDLLLPEGISPVGEIARGPCEIISTCDGVNVALTGNVTLRTPKGPMYQCRAPTGPCEQPTFCPDPNLVTEWWICPPAVLYNATEECRSATGPCDEPEFVLFFSRSFFSFNLFIYSTVRFCTLGTTECPADIIKPNGTLCFTPTGVCQNPSYCNGAATTCPVATFLPTGTTCRPAVDTCDADEQCDGASAACPPDQVLANTTSCHIPQGSCEQEVKCPGPGGPSPTVCPPRVFLSGATECRMAEGPCDVAENCDPLSATPWECPIDTVKANGELCRTSTDLCDAPETCDGALKTCPVDIVYGSSQVCRVPQGGCEIAVNCNGISTSCDPRQFLGTNVVCRLSASACDISETCDPFTVTPWECPPDLYYSNTTICASPLGSCGTAGFCTGTSGTCPGVNFLPNTTVCRPANTQCDDEDSCTGTSDVCPTDVRKPLNTPCMADALNCTVDACNGFGACVRQSHTCDCFQNSDCFANDTCIIASCLNGFCQQQLAPGFCYIDGGCQSGGTNKPGNPCLSCQPTINPNDWTPTVTGTLCSTGNPTGVCSAQDTCNGAGVCVDNYLGTAVTCREAAHFCDEPESCPGGSDYCIVDTFKPPGTKCRNATDTCDAEEFCPSGGGPCPADVAQPSTVLCLAARGDCEGSAYCRGTIPSQDPLAKACPTPLLLSSAFTCRAAATICDKEEKCDPLAVQPWLCPVDAVQNSTVQCHLPSGPCDVPKFCDGITKTCPAPSLFGPLRLCRASSASCENNGYCTLGTDQCEPVTYVAQGTICQPSGQSCAAPAVCTGNSSACPPSTPLANGTQCFAPRGVCEDPGTCDGASLACQLQGFKPLGTVCRASIDSERCDPSDACSGNSFDCPADSRKPDGSPCPDALYCNGDETCQSGVCQVLVGPRNCSDSSLCTTDSCDENANVCIHALPPSVGQICYDGPMGTINVGRCRSGIVTCNAVTGVSSCQGQVLPLFDEICGNGIDDDCNGVPDDACSGLTCLTVADCTPFIPSVCQTAACVSNTCQYPIQPNVCRINGVCIASGTPQPGMPCKTCIPAASQITYTPDPSVNPSDNNACNGVEQCVAGNLILNPLPLQCPFSGNPCLPFSCSPSLGCIQQVVPIGDPCVIPEGTCVNGTATCNVDNQCVCDGFLQLNTKTGDNPHKVVWIPLTIVGSILLGFFLLFVALPMLFDRQREASELRRVQAAKFN